MPGTTVRNWSRCAVAALPLLCLIAPVGLAQDARHISSSLSQSSSATWQAALPAVHLDGHYFTSDGHRFIPVGAHWVPAKAAMQWPTQWDPKDIEADFAKMAQLGYTVTRFDMLWAWFEPRPGDYNPQAFQQLDYLVSLARKYHVYLHPSLFIGGEVGEAYWDVPWRHGRHPHADAEMLRLETNLAEEFGRRYANETAILAWDLNDEPPLWIVSSQTSDAMAINWTRLIAGGIRRYDHLHPIVIGTSGQELSHGPFRADNIAREVDFFSIHPFTIYNLDLYPDPMLSERGTYGAAFEIGVSGGAGRPVMIHETGGSTAQYSPEIVAAYDRAMIHSGIGAGALGIDLWCFSDAAPEQFLKVPYLRTPQETGWGMVTWDRQDKPLAREFKKISQVVAKLDLMNLATAPADSAIVIPDEWAKPHGDFSRSGLTGPEVIPYVSTEDHDAIPGQGVPDNSADSRQLLGSALNAFILLHRSGLKADFPREYADWGKRPMVFLPYPLTSTGGPFLTHVHTDFYAKARKYVEGGGALYASISAGSGIPNMESLFGARMVDAITTSEITLKVIEAFGNLKVGDTFHYSLPSSTQKYWGSILEVNSGKVIAVDQDGHPALVANSLGKGKTLLCAYPIESYLAVMPSAFEKPENTHLIYDSFRQWVNLTPLFRADRPSVEVSALLGSSRGYAVVVNHCAQSGPVTIQSRLPIRSVRRITPENDSPLTLNGSEWKMDLGPFEGAVVEWAQ
jgi:endo-1,4-beta-mannosidase